jgi:hypothetical protein
MSLLKLDTGNFTSNLNPVAKSLAFKPFSLRLKPKLSGLALTLVTAFTSSKLSKSPSEINNLSLVSIKLASYELDTAPNSLSILDASIMLAKYLFPVSKG